MKKLKIIFTAMLLFLLSSSFAFDTAVSARIKTVFEKDFALSSDLKWTKYEDFYIASFKLNGVYLTAAYNDDGELLAVTRYIGYSQLPLKVSRALEEKYGAYTIAPSIIELSADQTNYFITVENEKFILKLKADAYGYLSVEKRIKKKVTKS